MVRTKGAGGSAVERIQELILAEGLVPGDPMPTETALCERLEISRSSVREAMRTLASLDIVEVRHGHGTFVGQLSLAPLVNGLLFRARLDDGNDLRALREVVELRIAIDLSVADQLVDIYRGTVNPELESLVEEMRTLAGRGEPFPQADAAFHSTLFADLANGLMRQLAQAFWEIHTTAVPMLGLAPAEDILDTVEAHRAMLVALEAGDADAYRAAVHEHYRPLGRTLDAAAETGRTAALR
ncbi:FadR/GntR family transcriptional regulator [Brachybacterium fresconis]|uniref:DNA-binding FadR family transcriptional regulator n=1 Tax=Brachybacterium fresconis TaxID=173363 RepID=A0ABS4YQ40_9MICO|nr:GntR family transcriptional regulator [Brachybacterium fresconis]MBP2410585.1 DNA-binding FadR family transcriptional regulator [Brachybacterium fresconis]